MTEYILAYKELSTETFTKKTGQRMTFMNENEFKFCSPIKIYRKIFLRKKNILTPSTREKLCVYIT